MPQSDMGSLALALLLLQFTSTVDSANVFNEFKKVSKCPTNLTEKVAESGGVSSKIDCGSVCNLRPTCDSFSFEPTNGTCFLGDTRSAEENQWKVGDCEVFVYNGVAKTGDNGADTTQPDMDLQLKLLYKFRSSDLVNSVNPRRHGLTPSDSIVNGNGAQVWGRQSSYLSTVSPEFENFLNSGGSYSMYLRLNCKQGNDVTLVSFVKTDMTSDAGVELIMTSGFFLLSMKTTSDAGEILYFYNSGFPQSDDGQSNVAVGIVVNATAHEVNERYYIYKNGSLEPNIMVVATDGATPDSFHRLLLGASLRSDSFSINGTLLCFGLSTKAFSRNDFENIEAMCDKT